MLTSARSIHLVGICGSAMGAVAVALQKKGFQVTGSDQNIYPPMSHILAEHGIAAASGYSEANLSGRPDLVVIGNAVSRGNPEVEAVLERRLRYCSMPELLKEFFIRGKRSIVVSGTHGKTTTASLLAWVFEHNGLNPSFLIGGAPKNFNAGARFTESEWFILEGDEYDTAFFDKRAKFLHYLPEIALINNIEFDHADIYDSLAAIQESFRRLIHLVPRNGQLFANGDDLNIAPLLNGAPCPVKRFGFGPQNAIQATHVRCGATASEFELPSCKFHLDLLGEFNVRNALGVVACAKHCGLKNSEIQSAFSTFLGVKRRLETRGIAGGVQILDDFGHHPTAIRETLQALRLKYPTQRLWAIFEPRSNTTRRNVFQESLPAAFQRADQIVIAEVARLESLPVEQRLDPSKLIRDLIALGRKAVYLPKVEEIVAFVAREAEGGDVICVFSNGGFGEIHTRLLRALAPRDRR